MARWRRVVQELAGPICGNSSPFVNLLALVRGNPCAHVNLHTFPAVCNGTLREAASVAPHQPPPDEGRAYCTHQGITHCKEQFITVVVQYKQRRKVRYRQQVVDLNAEYGALLDWSAWLSLLPLI